MRIVTGLVASLLLLNAGFAEGIFQQGILSIFRGGWLWSPVDFEGFSIMGRIRVCDVFEYCS